MFILGLGFSIQQFFYVLVAVLVVGAVAYLAITGGKRFGPPPALEPDEEVKQAPLPRAKGFE